MMRKFCISVDFRIIYYFFCRKLVEDFLQTMFDTGADFTNSFRHLHEFQTKDEDTNKLVEILLTFCCGLDELKEFNKPKYPKEYILIYFFLLLEILFASQRCNSQKSIIFLSNLNLKLVLSSCADQILDLPVLKLYFWISQNTFFYHKNILNF
jgi:hypothetical protein